jgi:ATP-dependent DNA helicase RecQ
VDETLEPDRQDELTDYFMGAETDDLDLAERTLAPDYSREEIQLMRIKFYSENAN